MLGFANVAVVTNNCTDRSPELLDALEAAGGITSAYPALRAFRDRHPDIPVILLSDEFSTDDFGTDRLALCDVRDLSGRPDEVAYGLFGTVARHFGKGIVYIYNARAGFVKFVGFSNYYGIVGIGNYRLQ